MSAEKPSPRECSDKDFVLEVPHDSLQKRIITLGHEDDLFLMLAADSGYGERNHEEIIKNIAEGIFDDPPLRKALFPEDVDSKEEVLPFLRGSSVRARLINEYIQLTIAYQLEQDAKKKAKYLENYITGRLKVNAMRRLNVMKTAVTTRKLKADSDLKKERDRLVGEVDFAPILQAELVSFLKDAPCIPLFEMFFKQKGIVKEEAEVNHLIEIAVKDEVVATEITSLLSRIQRIRKSENKKVVGQKRETNKLAFKALGPRLEGEKEEILKEKRKKRDTVQGYLMKPGKTKEEDHDGVPFMKVAEVDDLLEEDIEMDLIEEDVDFEAKPTPRLYVLPALPTPTAPEMSPFKIPTPPPPIPLNARLKGAEPNLSGPVHASQVFNEIEQRDRSGQIDVPDPSPIIGDDVPVLDLDDEPDTVVVDVSSEEGHRDVMAPISGQALMAEDVAAAHPVVLPPLPASADKEKFVEEYLTVGLDFGFKVAVAKMVEDVTASLTPFPALADKEKFVEEDLTVAVGGDSDSAAEGTKKIEVVFPPLPAESDSNRGFNLGPAVAAAKSVAEAKSQGINPKHVPAYYKGLYLDPTAAYDPESTDEEEVAELTTVGKISKWAQRHVVKIAGVVTLTGVGIAGYYMYNKNEENKKDKNKSALKLAHNTTKDDGRKIAPPLMSRLDEPMNVKPMQSMRVKPVKTVKSASDAMKSSIIKKLPKDMAAPKVRVAPKKRPVVASKPKTAPKSVVAPKTVDVKGVSSTSAKTLLAAIDTKSLKDLPDGVYKDMWEGKSFDIQGAPHSSITGFMEKHLKGMIEDLPTEKAKRQAKRAYKSTLNKLQKGWLIHMSERKEVLLEKSLQGNLTDKEAARLQGILDYFKEHKYKKIQAKRAYSKYKRLKRKGGKRFHKLQELKAMSVELMEGLEELNPHILDVNNVPVGKEIRFALAGKVLKTFWRFAHVMKLQMPDKFKKGKRGELQLKNNLDAEAMVAEHIKITDDMIVKDPTPPPIPKDAQVHDVDDLDIEEAIPMYGMEDLSEVDLTPINFRKSTPPPIPEAAKGIVRKIKSDKKKKNLRQIEVPELELKPIIADIDARLRAPKMPAHVRNHKPLNGEISHNDVYSEVSLEGLDGSDYEDFSAEEVKVVTPGSKIDLPKQELKPILADMIKKSQNDYSEYTVEEGPGEYDTYSVPEAKPKSVAVEEQQIATPPPPSPAMAEVEEPKKKGLWGKVKNFFKRAA